MFKIGIGLDSHRIGQRDKGTKGQGGFDSWRGRGEQGLLCGGGFRW